MIEFVIAVACCIVAAVYFIMRRPSVRKDAPVVDTTDLEPPKQVNDTPNIVVEKESSTTCDCGQSSGGTCCKDKRSGEDEDSSGCCGDDDEKDACCSTSNNSNSSSSSSSHKKKTAAPAVRRRSCRVLYGTIAGSAANLANSFAQRLRSTFPEELAVTCGSLEEYEGDTLLAESGFIVLVVSTYTEGTPPPSAVR
jgi:hypothetical protein